MKGMNKQSLLQTTPSKPALRTWELKLLAAGFLIVSAFGWLRMEQALATWNWLLQVLPSPSPNYLTFSGAVWGLMGIVCALGLWLRFKGAPPFVRATACVMALWYWSERILLTRSPQGWVNWPFSLFTTILCLMFVFAVLAHPRQNGVFDR